MRERERDGGWKDMIKVHRLELIIINNYFYLRRRLTNKKKWPISYYTYNRLYNEGTIKSFCRPIISLLSKRNERKKKRTREKEALENSPIG